MCVIIEDLSTGETSTTTSLVVACMMTGLNVMELLPGREGNGYRVVSMFRPVYPRLAHRV